MSRADLIHLRRALSLMRYYMVEYSELFSDEDDEIWAVANQIIEEKFDD